MAALRTSFFLVDVDDAMVDVGAIAPYDEERRNALEEAPDIEHGLIARETMNVDDTNATLTQWKRGAQPEGEA